MESSNRIVVMDTTLRDGEQAPGCQLGQPAKQEIAEQLARLGVDVIEAGFPASSPGDFEAVRGIADTVGRKKDAPTIGALARCVESDIESCYQALRRASHPRIHVFLATSDIHLQHKLKIPREEALRRIQAGVRWARRRIEDVQFSPEDASRTDPEFLVEAVRAALEEGASVINIPDTVGYATPDEFGGLIRFLRQRVDMKRAIISVHCHDDLGLAVANTLAAVRAGARQVECTVNGVGERAGNCALEEVVMSLRVRKDVYGIETGVQTAEIAAASRLVSSHMQMPVSPNKPVVGSNAFSHASGVHQDGMLKNRQTYEIMRPEDVGRGPSSLVLTSRSGRMALQSRLGKLGYELAGEALEKAFHAFKEMADRRRVVSDEDLKRLAQRA